MNKNISNHRHLTFTIFKLNKRIKKKNERKKIMQKVARFPRSYIYAAVYVEQINMRLLSCDARCNL